MLQVQELTLLFSKGFKWDPLNHEQQPHEAMQLGHYIWLQR